jgi:hypothetical protein
MPELNIVNSAGRDATINLESVTTPLKVRWLDPDGRQAQNVRVLKSTIELDVDALTEKFGDLQGVGEALIREDPEIDLEHTGSFLRNTSRVFIDTHRQMVHKVQQFDIIRNPDGSQRDRRPRVVPPQNVTEELPLQWSGKMIKKSDACRRFVFIAKQQLMHINGLTFDFLYGMAKELAAADSLMMLGAGPKANQPLVLRRGGAPYRGFLEGRIDSDKYCLILHLSNLELKMATAADDS